MSADIVIERLFEALVDGNRPAARAVIDEQRNTGASPELVVTDLLWPVHENIEKLFKQDRLTPLSYHLATRLLRSIVDQQAIDLLNTPREEEGTGAGRTVAAFCGESENSELGAQMAVDLLEAAGFNVRFAGGGVPADEIQATVQESAPDVLLMFCSEPSDLPGIRGLIDNLHEIGACPNTQIVVGGGVFNRAEGLAEEIGADLWAGHPLELVDAMIYDHDQRATPDQRTVGRNRGIGRQAA